MFVSKDFCEQKVWSGRSTADGSWLPAATLATPARSRRRGNIAREAKHKQTFGNRSIDAITSCDSKAKDI